MSYVKCVAVYPATAYAMPQLQAVLPDSDPTNTTVWTPTIFLSVTLFSVDYATYLGIYHTFTDIYWELGPKCDRR